MARRTSAARLILAHGALVVLGLASGLALAEGIARLSWRPPQVPAPPVVRPRDGLPVLRTLMQLVRPNVRGVMSNGVYFRTNSLGVRGPEYSPRPGPGVFRIVVAGDSVTAGSKVEETDAYPARLEAALGARGGPYRYEVVNLGLAGLDIGRVVERLERIGLPYEPDLVVYGWTMNDIAGPGYRSFERPRGAGYLHRAVYERYDRSPSYLLRILWPRWVALREAVDPSPHSYAGELRYNYFENPAAWDPFAAQLARLAEIGDKRDVCVAVLLHTALNRLNAFHPLRSIYDRVAAAARAEGLFVVPSLHHFVGRDEDELVVGPFDPHPNAQGHALLAAALLEGWDALPERCRRMRPERAALAGEARAGSS